MARPKSTPVATTPRQESAPKKISLDKFRSWLEGVEEMQADDWTPSPEQWRRIRTKIDDIQDMPAAGPRNRFVEDEAEDRQPRGPVRQAGPSAFAAGPATMQQQPSSLVVEEGPANIQAPGVKSTGTRIKTPNIDTSQGGYVGAFE